MSVSTFAEIDLIEELRHRRWARENYVAVADRDRSWHPVVLDEMRRRDRELREVRIDCAQSTSVAAYDFAAVLVGAQRTP
jgi:hypothetical protein